MKTRISKSDFTFTFAGYGEYFITYTSPKTGKCWTRCTNNMELIDLTKNSETPKIKDLENLKRFCKS